MREIKFRVKDTDGKWVYFDLVNKQLWDVPDGMFDLTTLTQWTGLMDKTNKEIYEGDIVKWYDEIYDIRFGECQINLGEYDCYGYYLNSDLTSDPAEILSKSYEENLEIIGDIYDNPELLEKK